MSLRDKILLSLVPFLLATILWFSLASQAYVDWQEKDKQIADKTREQVVLKSKLLDLVKIQKERVRLNQDIESLRNAVPKSPDVDLLLIDLEKMCQDSKMELVTLEKSDEKAVAESQSQENEASETAQPAGKGKGKQGGHGGKKTKGNEAGGKAADKPKSLEEEAGLNKQMLDVAVIGDYPSLIQLMKKLQSYQRVIGLSDLKIALPPATEKANKDLNKHLLVTFYLTAYYLP